MIPKRLQKDVLRAEKWLSLTKITYQDRRGKTRFWEAAERTTRTTNSDIDAVAILTVLKQTGEPMRTILVKQYRPALNCYTFECPAGLVDEGESAETTALRELKEETGLVATVVSKSPVIFNDPGTSMSCYQYVTCLVDMDKEENKNAKPAEDEDTEVHSVEVSQLRQFLDDATSAEPSPGHPRIVVDAGLYSLSMGLGLIAGNL